MKPPTVPEFSTLMIPLPSGCLYFPLTKTMKARVTIHEHEGRYYATAANGALRPNKAGTIFFEKATAALNSAYVVYKGSIIPVGQDAYIYTESHMQQIIDGLQRAYDQIEQWMTSLPAVTGDAAALKWQEHSGYTPKAPVVLDPALSDNSILYVTLLGGIPAAGKVSKRQRAELTQVTPEIFVLSKGEITLTAEAKSTRLSRSTMRGEYSYYLFHNNALFPFGMHNTPPEQFIQERCSPDDMERLRTAAAKWLTEAKQKQNKEAA